LWFADGKKDVVSPAFFLNCINMGLLM